MSRQARLLTLLVSAGALSVVVLAWLLVPRQLATASQATAQDLPPPGAEHFKSSKNYSPYADRLHPTRVYWGEQHLHTSYSSDAGLVGDRLGPDDAFRFARGEQM